MTYIHVKNHCKNATCQNFNLMFTDNSKSGIKRKMKQSMRKTVVTNLHHTGRALGTDQDSTPFAAPSAQNLSKGGSPTSGTWGRRERDANRDTAWHRRYKGNSTITGTNFQFSPLWFFSSEDWVYLTATCLLSLEKGKAKIADPKLVARIPGRGESKHK